MFCFPSHSQRKERRKKFSPGLTSDFSQSASALNHLTVPTSPDCIVNMCHSDSNISALPSFSIVKRAVIKSMVRGSKRDVSATSAECVVEQATRVECVVEQATRAECVVKQATSAECVVKQASASVARDPPAFAVKENISFIDGEPSSPSHESVKLVSEPKISVESMSPASELSLPNNLRMDHLQLNVVEVDSSSGNSSSSDGIAPMASPEGSPPMASPESPPESGVSSPGPEASELLSSPRARYQLLSEGDVQVCHLNHTRTIVSKVLSSKFLRRWETHHVILEDTQISSRTPTGFLEQPVPYTNVHDLYPVQRWDRFCIRLVIPDGSILLQVNSAFVRDQWEHSIKWKRSMNKYRKMLRTSSRPDVILKEIKNLVEFSVSSPIQDESALSAPIEIISSLLQEDELWSERSRRDEVIEAMAPLLENTSPTKDMCRFFSHHCSSHPRSPVVTSVFTPIVQRILKRNVDFGKFPLMRVFVADFIKAIHSQNNGDEAINCFVMGVHGSGCCCPHPRVLPNLVAATLAAIFAHFEQRRASHNETDSTDRSQAVTPLDKQLRCYLTVFLAISEVEDWRCGLAQLLQPVPLPDDALASAPLVRALAPMVRRIGTDPRCEVHSMVLGVRPGKDGWLHVYCPSSNACVDGGALWCEMLETLIGCCRRRKNFLSEMVKKVGALQLVALRDQGIAQDLLCLMLEWQLLGTEEQQLQVVTTLQSTDNGKDKYRELCKRQDHLRELQQKGGPRKLTLPSRSTDADVAQLLSGGSFGNLECLSLAFTHVTSACAHHLIQLPALRYLNLWATQFGDLGLQIIADHLDRLQVLNLCETPVTDKGIAALVGMTNLKKLNLNSTKLSMATLEKIKSELPGLQELDVRYTDAW